MLCPLPIIYIKDRKNDIIYINKVTKNDDANYRMILFENCSDIHIIVNVKLLKLSCIKCENISLDINVDMVAGIDYHKVDKSVVIVKNKIPLLDLSSCENIHILQRTNISSIYSINSCNNCKIVNDKFIVYKIGFNNSPKLVEITDTGSKILIYDYVLNNISHYFFGYKK